HPHIVPVHAVGWTEAEGPLIVMKRIEGASWHALLRDPLHPLLEAAGQDMLERHLAIFLDVCQAVRFAHSRGVLHRDIKPANVMVGAFGEVYLLDWGVALTREQRAAGVAPRVAGTPAYMAPEMV